MSLSRYGIQSALNSMIPHLVFGNLCRQHAAENGINLEAARAGMRADRHVQLRRPLVDREEIRVADQPVARLHPPEVHRHRSMIFREAKLLLHLIHRQHRHGRCPAQPSLALRPHVRHPPVVAAAERRLFGGVVRQRPGPQRRVQHLHVCAKLVHVPDARSHVEQELRIHRKLHVVDEQANFALLAAAGPRGADLMAADDPALRHLARFERLVLDPRLEVPLPRVHVLPRGIDLEDVSVSVDDSHGVPPVCRSAPCLCDSLRALRAAGIHQEGFEVQWTPEPC